jgi:glycosyltransferase involved in cell wall biosynthesis
MNKTISILIPTFNEEKNIEKICLEIFRTTSNMNYSFEIVFSTSLRI